MTTPQATFNTVLVMLFETDLALIEAINESNRLLALWNEMPTHTPESLYKRSSVAG
jgi:hypothetical protein